MAVIPQSLQAHHSARGARTTYAPGHAARYAHSGVTDPVPARRRVATRAPARRTNAQRDSLAVMLSVATVAATIGVLCLSGYAAVNVQGHRRVALLHELRSEQAKTRYWTEALATASSATAVEQKGVALGMIPADEAHTVTLSSGAAP